MASDALLPLIANDVAATAGSIGTKWMGGRGWFSAEATAWGGGSVKLQWKSPNGTYIDIDATNLNFTANNVYGFEAPPGELRAVRSTATGVYAYAIGTRIR